MNRHKLERQVTFGVIFIAIGLSCLLSDFIVERREKTFAAMNLELTELLSSDSSSDVEVTTSEEQDSLQETESQQVSEEQTDSYESYAGILEIEKINFSRGFYKKESDLNNVKFNIKILSQSNYPDEEKGNVIIIGHSGNYSNSYFGNLYQLEKGDTAVIQYHYKKYTYQIVNIYDVDKTGTVTIYRDETKSCLTLITCTKDDDTKQTVYILEQVSVE